MNECACACVFCPSDDGRNQSPVGRRNDCQPLEWQRPFRCWSFHGPKNKGESIVPSKPIDFNSRNLPTIDNCFFSFASNNTSPFCSSYCYFISSLVLLLPTKDSISDISTTWEASTRKKQKQTSYIQCSLTRIPIDKNKQHKHKNWFGKRSIFFCTHK